MRIYSLSPKKECPYVLEISKYRKGRDYVFAAMQILNYSFRDIAKLCGYKGDEEFEVFIRRLTKGHRLKVESPMFVTLKSIIDNKLRKVYNDEMDKQNLEVVRQKENSNRDSSVNGK